MDAKRVIDDFPEWERVMRSKDLFEVADFRSTHQGLPLVDALYYKLRDAELKKMKETPPYMYSLGDIEKLINIGVFTRRQLEDEGLVTEDSWKKMNYDLTLLPNICDLMLENPNVQTAQNSTDVFFFRMPGAGGKTCLLMSLAGNNGKGYLMKTTDNAGKYAAGLSQYYKEGQLPGRTFGKYWAAIETVIQAENSNHKVNFVEMSGEAFFCISEDSEVSFDKIDISVCKLLRNDNRKIFFLHFDPTLEKIKLDAIEPIYDSNGELIDERVKNKVCIWRNSFVDVLVKIACSRKCPNHAACRCDTYFSTQSRLVGRKAPKRREGEDDYRTTLPISKGRHQALL